MDSALEKTNDESVEIAVVGKGKEDISNVEETKGENSTIVEKENNTTTEDKTTENNTTAAAISTSENIYKAMYNEILARKKNLTNEPSPEELAEKKRLSELLTPETVKREFINMMRNFYTNPMSTNVMNDPRSCNCPLPNDARLEKKYGHFAFTADCYPGYVWHNGFWHKEHAALMFAEPSAVENNKLLSIPENKYQTELLKEGMLDMSFRMDDAFYPVLIDGIRVFLREYWHINKYNSLSNVTSGLSAYSYQETIMYIPDLQGCQRSPVTRFSKHDVFVPEDLEYYNKLPKLPIIMF